jgi:hypothetical protein
MSSSPDLIDMEIQQEKGKDDYWKGRQGISFGGSGSGECLDDVQLGIYAKVLLDKSVTVATGAATKKTYEFPAKVDHWSGADASRRSNGDGNSILRKFKRFRRRQFSSLKTQLETDFPPMQGDDPVCQRVYRFIDVGLEMTPEDVGTDDGGVDNEGVVLLPNLTRSKDLLKRVRGGDFPDDLSVSSEPDEDLAEMDGEEQEEEGGEQQEGTGETMPSDPASADESAHLQATHLDRYVEFQRLAPVSMYNKHFSKTVRNVHTSKIRMIAVRDESGKVWLEHAPMRSHVRGGQIYLSHYRVDIMDMPRPRKSEVLQIISHLINIMRRGAHLKGVTVTDSMRIVAELMNYLTEILDHVKMRREHQPSNVVRMELFFAYHDGICNVDQYPDFDPTECVDMFLKKEVYDFEAKILKTHLDPCKKLLGGIGAASTEDRLLELHKYSPELRTRLLGSMEILVQYVADQSPNTFVIQKNLMTGIRRSQLPSTVDLPPRVRVHLSREERISSGFQYGIYPDLLPLSDVNTAPPRRLADVHEGDFSMDFPPFFSGADRSVFRSLSKGRVNVGMLERAKAQVDKMILNCPFDVQRTRPDYNASLMHVVDYSFLMRMDYGKRLTFLKHLARLVIVHYVHTTWQVCVKGKIFGPTPPLEVDVGDGVMVSPLEFSFFPFVKEKVTKITAIIPSTNFVDGGTVSSTGKGCHNKWGLSLVVFPFFLFLTFFFHVPIL